MQLCRLCGDPQPVRDLNNPSPDSAAIFAEWTLRYCNGADPFA